jgi:hypothetical protein
MERKILKCQNCSQNGVVDCYGKIFCLLHYHIICGEKQVPHYTIISDLDLNEQKGVVEELWKDAISDVVMRMFEYEKMEQIKLNEDPLSILTLNAPRVPIERQKSTSSESRPAPRSKKQKVDPLSWSSSSLSATTPAVSEMESSSLQVQGSRCSNCHSERTYLETGIKNWSSSGRDTVSTKAETWAFKDSPSAVTEDWNSVKSICRDCGFETIEG